jgi:hypothetical protein
MPVGPNIIRNFDALRELLSIEEQDQIMIGRRLGSRGNLSPRRMDMFTFSTQLFGLPIVQTQLCNFLEGALISEGAGVPLYDGFDTPTCTAPFRSLTAGTGITLDDTTNPGEIIISASVAGGGDGIYGGSGSLIENTVVTMAGFTLDFLGGDITMDGCLGVGGPTNPFAQVLVTTVKRDGINIENVGAVDSASGIIARNFSTGLGEHLGGNFLASGPNAEYRAGIKSLGGVASAIPSISSLPYNNIGVVAEGYGDDRADENVGLYASATATGADKNVAGHFIAPADDYGIIVESGQVVIGNTTSHASAITQIDSTTQGLLVPRMDGGQETALDVIATEGLIIYNLDDDKFRGFSAGAFVNLQAHTIEDNGTPVPQQPTLNFIGATVADNPGNNSTDITIAGGGGVSDVGPVVDIVNFSYITSSNIGSGSGGPSDLTGQYNSYEVGKALIISYALKVILTNPTTSPNAGAKTVNIKLPDLVPFSGNYTGLLAKELRNDFFAQFVDNGSIVLGRADGTIRAANPDFLMQVFGNMPVNTKEIWINGQITIYAA